jgi:hypothetical protein
MVRVANRNGAYKVPSAGDKSQAHFSFGTDPTTYESVSHRDLQAPTRYPLPAQPHAHAAGEGHVSNVLDNPDGEAGNVLSVQRQDYCIPTDLRREDLIVDNTQSLHNLRGTHFILSNGYHGPTGSQYRTSFRAPQVLEGGRMERAKRHELGNVTGANNRVISEDQGVRRLGQSTNRTDFVDHRAAGTHVAAKRSDVGAVRGGGLWNEGRCSRMA